MSDSVAASQSAVDFPGRFRVHIALTVSNLERSKRFYEILLGVAPSKVRPGYAKFEPHDPSVNLTLNETSQAITVEGGAAHFGVQVKSVAEVHDAIERFKAAGIETSTEDATTCCYAVQDKAWAIDPDGHRWEVFVVLQADVPEDNRCCGPEVMTLDRGDNRPS